MDLVFSVLLLILFLPVILIIMLVICFTMRAPIFFCQQRPGLDGKLFKIFKFRTMKEMFDDQGNALPDGKRLIPFGRFLRRTSLDELPELLNVLKGDMSFIGPRPLLVKYLPLYSKEQMRRHEVRPGLTGWAQVNGRNAISWEDKFRLDVWYVDNMSFWLDLKIVLWTIVKILKREGINQPGLVTAEEFKGA
jgi:lipopolysaccharide/colanic/teichoic acid biosynthesis glycosyltransferase